MGRVSLETRRLFLELAVSGPPPEDLSAPEQARRFKSYSLQLAEAEADLVILEERDRPLPAPLR